MTTNTEKRRREAEVIRDMHPLIKQQVFAQKRAFFDIDGTNLSDDYEIILKTTDKQVRGLKGKDELEMHEIENGRFIFMFFESSRLLIDRYPSLSPQDVARLMFIGTYVAWESNRLQSDNGKKILKKKDVEQLVGMSTKRFNELYNRYKDEGILIEGENGELYLSPTVVYRGNVKKLGSSVVDLSYTRVFRKTARDLYSKFNGRKLGQLAIVYSVIPFLNFESNVVCFNPGETVTELVRPLSIRELSEILGYKDPAKFKTALNGIKVDGEPMFTFAEDPHNRREKRIIVNPKVIYAGNGEHLAAIKVLFQ